MITLPARFSLKSIKQMSQAYKQTHCPLTARAGTWQCGQGPSLTTSLVHTPVWRQIRTQIWRCTTVCNTTAWDFESPWKCLSSVTSKSSCRSSATFFCLCCLHKCCMQTLLQADFQKRKRLGPSIVP